MLEAGILFTALSLLCGIAHIVEKYNLIKKIRNIGRHYEHK